MDQKTALLHKFINHCKEELQIKVPFKVTFTNKQLEQPTAGFFDPNTMEIVVCTKGRAMADYLRTLAHEMTHLKQLVNDNAEFPNDDEGLQPFEDNANLMSGRIIRFWGRKHPQIYSL